MNSINNKQFLKTSLLLFILYSLSYWLILINPYTYWDGLLISTIEPSALLETFREAGSPWTGYFHLIILNYLDGIIFYRIATFILYFLSGIILLKIFHKLELLNPIDTFWLVLFFLILPINFSRISIICFPYTLCFFFFWLATLYLLLYLETNKHRYQLVSLVLFFLSFNTNSLLVYYYVILFLIFLYWICKKKLWKFNKLYSFFKNKILFLLIPIIFWFLKTTIFKPYGSYSGYNKTSLAQLYPAVFNTFTQIKLFFIYSYKLYIDNLYLTNLNIILLITIGIVTCYCLYFFNKQHIAQYNEKKNNLISYIILIITGFILLFAGAYPYVVIGTNIYNYFDWVDRNQLLVSLGVAFIIVSVLNLTLVYKYFRVTVFIVLCTAFIFINNKIYYSFLLDGVKQTVLLQKIKKNDIFKKNNTFYFIDHSKQLSAIKRTYRFYELSSLFKKAFGEETRFGYTHVSVLPIQEIRNGLYNLKNYINEENKVDYQVTIILNNYPNCFQVIKYSFLKLFSKVDINNLNNIIALKFDKI